MEALMRKQESEEMGLSLDMEGSQVERAPVGRLLSLLANAVELGVDNGEF